MENEKKAPIKVEKNAKQLEQEKRAADLALLEKQIPKMSHRQLSAELRRRSNKTYEGKGFAMPPGMDFGDFGGKKSKVRSGESNALATILLTVLENTKTAKVFEYKEDGNPRRFARKDQIGTGTLSHFLR